MKAAALRRDTRAYMLQALIAAMFFSAVYAPCPPPEFAPPPRRAHDFPPSPHENITFSACSDNSSHANIRLARDTYTTADGDVFNADCRCRLMMFQQVMPLPAPAGLAPSRFARATHTQAHAESRRFCANAAATACRAPSSFAAAFAAVAGVFHADNTYATPTPAADAHSVSETRC